MFSQDRGGRPLKFKTPEELEAACEAYLESCFDDRPVLDKHGNALKNEDGAAIKEQVQVRPITVTGLAVALDTDRKSLMRYEQGDFTSESIGKELRSRLSHTIKKYKAICERFAEEQLYELRNPAGAIFSLKNNWGWVDKTEVTVNEVPDKLNLDDIANRIKNKVKLEKNKDR